MSQVHVPDIDGPRAYLCWQQGGLDVSMARCDRKLGHAGLHSWEMAPEVKRYQAMQCCGCQRWDVRGAEVMGHCGKWLIQTPALHGCLAWEKRND